MSITALSRLFLHRLPSGRSFRRNNIFERTCIFPINSNSIDNKLIFLSLWPRLLFNHPLIPKPLNLRHNLILISLRQRPFGKTTKKTIGLAGLQLAWMISIVIAANRITIMWVLHWKFRCFQDWEHLFAVFSCCLGFGVRMLSCRTGMNVCGLAHFIDFLLHIIGVFEFHLAVLVLGVFFDVLVDYISVWLRLVIAICNF